MTEKELKKLNRKQLLELLLAQTKQTNKLMARVKDLEQKLADRRILEKESGSIAEAALRLSGVFEAAQSAADLYLENLKLTAGHGPESAEISKSEAESEEDSEKLGKMTEETEKEDDASALTEADRT